MIKQGNISIKMNFVLNSILNMSNTILPMITFPYLARVLGPEGNGTVAFVQSIVSYFTMVAVVGVPNYGIREVASRRYCKADLSKLVHEILIINSISLIIILIVYYLSICFVSKFREEWLLMAISGLMIILEVYGVEWFYKGLEQYKFITIRRLVFKLIAITMMFILVKSKDDYIKYGIIFIVFNCGSYILNFFYLKKFIDIKFVQNYNIRQHIRPIATFFGSSISTKISTNLDTVMLGLLCGNGMVGYFNVAIKIKLILIGLITSLGVVIYPRLAYYVNVGDFNNFKKILQKAINFIFLSGIPVVVYFLFEAKDSIKFLAGSEYNASVIIMQCMSPTVLIVCLNCLLGEQILLVENLQQKVLKSVIIGMICNIIMNSILIPELGGIGASLATLVTEFLVFIIQIYYVRDLFFQLFKNSNFIKVIVATVISILILIGIKLLFDFSPFLNLLITAVQFFGTYAFILILLKEELIFSVLHDFSLKIKN